MREPMQPLLNLIVNDVESDTSAENIRHSSVFCSSIFLPLYCFFFFFWWVVTLLVLQVWRKKNSTPAQNGHSLMIFIIKRNIRTKSNFITFICEIKRFYENQSLKFLFLLCQESWLDSEMMKQNMCELLLTRELIMRFRLLQTV